MDMSVVIAAIGVFATAIGSYASYTIGRRSEYAVDSWMKELREWSKESIIEMSKLIYLCKEINIDSPKAVEIRLRLSSLVEVGRFYLPNQYPEVYGTHKLKANKGYRHPALDCLVASIEIIESSSLESSKKQFYYDRLRKIFVSIMTDILGPENHNKVMSKVVGRKFGRVEDKTLGGLLPDGKSTPLGSRGLICQLEKEYSEK